MFHANIINKTVAFVKTSLQGAEGGHDWFHIQRVWNIAREMAKTEKSDLMVVELAALLHDIADAKFNDGDEQIGPKTAEDFLRSLSVDEHVIEHVVNIVSNMSFRGGNFKTVFSSTEMLIVQDADRLDAMGAIGIDRAFNSGGIKNRALYNPAIRPNLEMDKETYKKSEAPTINHFYEKLLLLKDRMNTETGKRMAIKRHEFMERYLDNFFEEWNGGINELA